MITQETANLVELRAIAARVDWRRKRKNHYEPYSLEVTAGGAGLLKAHTDAAVGTIARWFEEAGALVLSIVTDGAQKAVAVTFKAAKHE